MRYLCCVGKEFVRLVKLTKPAAFVVAAHGRITNEDIHLQSIKADSKSLTKLGTVGEGTAGRAEEVDRSRRR